MRCAGTFGVAASCGSDGGQYALGTVPKSTRSRIRISVAAYHREKSLRRGTGDDACAPGPFRLLTAEHPVLMARDEIDLKSEIVGLSEYVFTARIRPRLVGLTDEEYLWEPVAACWSLRPDSDGVFRLDVSRPLPTGEELFTTLAWRLWHLISVYGARRNAIWLGVTLPTGAFDMFDPAPSSAAAALTLLDSAYGWWATAPSSV